MHFFKLHQYYLQIEYMCLGDKGLQYWTNWRDSENANGPIDLYSITAHELGGAVLALPRALETHVTPLGTSFFKLFKINNVTVVWKSDGSVARNAGSSRTATTQQDDGRDARQRHHSAKAPYRVFIFIECMLSLSPLVWFRGPLYRD